MEVAAVFLLAPLAIIIGHRRPTGAIIVSGLLATVVAIVVWIFLGGLQGLVEVGSETPINPLLLTLLVYGGLFGGIVLLGTTWTLALYSAASARRWGWIFLLVVSGYISFTALVIGISNPNPCVFVQASAWFATGPGCAAASPLVSLAFDVGHVLGPAVATLYGFVGASAPRRQPLPPDVRVTPLGTSGDEDTEPGLA
jgi:hypothetical protein